jgi:IclR family KDG regulon transcriptional repressor
MAAIRKKNTQRPSNLVQTIERVNAIFDVLSKNHQGISVKHLSEEVNFPTGTTHRLLTSLAYFGYVTQDKASKKYKLGFKLVNLSNALLSQIDLRTVARPYLINLAQKAKETVHLVILDQNESFYLDRVESSEHNQGLQMISKVGMRVPAHSSSVGKVLLAAFSEWELNEFIKNKGLERRTEKTITDADEFKQHIKMVREQGYAIDDEEDMMGTRCVAAPIRNDSGNAIAAISISGPATRITHERIQKTLKDLVMDCASEISFQLGCQEQGDP